MKCCSHDACREKCLNGAPGEETFTRVITITPSVIELGQVFAQWPDDKQAAFFYVVASVLTAWPQGAQSKQCHAIGRLLRGEPAAELLKTICDVFDERRRPGQEAR